MDIVAGASQVMPPSSKGYMHYGVGNKFFVGHVINESCNFMDMSS